MLFCAFCGVDTQDLRLLTVLMKKRRKKYDLCKHQVHDIFHFYVMFVTEQSFESNKKTH